MQLVRNNLLVLGMIVSFSNLQADSALAQHSDIEFGYDDGKIAIEFGDEGRVFEGEFPTSGIFEQVTTNPGFASEVDEGLGVNPGDIIDYNILGPLAYHNGTSFAPVPAGANIIIGDNPSGTLTVDDSTIGPVTGPGAIGPADAGGDLHSHIDFTLDPSSLDAPEYGAYGLLMELTTDAAGIANSSSFFTVFNFGLDEAVFEGAVGDFAAVVPEPASLAIAGMGIVVLGTARRRRGTPSAIVARCYVPARN